MTEQFLPHTFTIVIEGIANNFLAMPHFRAFIETDSSSPTVMMTTNDISEPHKVDFQNAIGGLRRDNEKTGIFVYMRWAAIPRSGDAITVTVWQQGAQHYEAPQPLPEENFDPANPTGIFEQGDVQPVVAR